MSIEGIIGSWKEVRSGLIDEADQIPADKFSFQAAPNTRSVARLLQHIIEAQKFLVGEVSQPDTNLLRRPFADQIKHYAPEVSGINDKDGLLNLLRASMEDAETQLTAAADELGLKLDFMSAPQETAEGKRMREWIADAIQFEDRSLMRKGAGQL